MSGVKNGLQNQKGPFPQGICGQNESKFDVLSQ